LEKGAIDLIVDRRQMRERLASLITLLMRIPAPTV
ncbi:MAG TPA: acetyl-CoA carboxylase carboxyl transferase subunit beta, partial [Burkholderiales bacterium]|nr:acetyl-CoA carboxylase carboxyl transferase subunit beta [Burkholderiales bacterium]